MHVLSPTYIKQTNPRAGGSRWTSTSPCEQLAQYLLPAHWLGDWRYGYCLYVMQSRFAFVQIVPWCRFCVVVFVLLVGFGVVWRFDFHDRFDISAAEFVQDAFVHKFGRRDMFMMFNLGCTKCDFSPHIRTYRNILALTMFCTGLKMLARLYVYRRPNNRQKRVGGRRNSWGWNFGLGGLQEQPFRIDRPFISHFYVCFRRRFLISFFSLRIGSVHRSFP